MNAFLIAISAIVLTVVLGVGLVHILMKVMLNEDIYEETCKHGEQIISECPQCHFGYDFQQDISNLRNDYEEDNSDDIYEYNDINEAELSQEWIQNHTEEDKN